MINWLDKDVMDEVARNYNQSKKNKLNKNEKKVIIKGKTYIKKTVQRKEWPYDTYEKYYTEPRMVLTRKIARNMAKKSVGSNKIRRTWRKFQIERYGVKEWCKMYNKCNCNSKKSYITPREAMRV